MNYIKVQKRQSDTVNVKIYDSKFSPFALNGEVALVRLFENGCDSGLEFVCSYKGNEAGLSFKTNDWAITQIASVPSYTITNGTKKQKVTQNLQTSVFTASVNGVDVNFEIWLLQDGQSKTIDFELHLEGDRLFVLEFTPADLNDLINKSQEVMF